MRSNLCSSFQATVESLTQDPADSGHSVLAKAASNLEIARHYTLGSTTVDDGQRLLVKRRAQCLGYPLHCHAVTGGLAMLRTIAALLLFLSILSSRAAVAETSPPAKPIVESALLALVRDLEVKAVQQSKGDKTAYFPQGPIDPALGKLGRPTEAFLSAPVEAQGLFNFTAGVNHEYGSSQWTISTTDDGRIVSYSYIIRESIAGAQAVKPDFTWQGDTWKLYGRPDLMHELTHGPGPNNDLQRIFPPTPPAVDPRIVEFLYATTRQATLNSPVERVVYGGDRGPLTFGAVSVRVPEDHKIGHIELPSSWKLFGITLHTETPSADKHFIIKRVAPLTTDQFETSVREKGAQSALVFVHGFDNSFDDSVYRAAQIFWDLQYNGLPVLFTWASRAELSPTGYNYDKESARLAEDSFVELLKKLRNLGVEQVNVIAHSMGNFVVVDALANYAQTTDPVQIAKLVMAAPDIDRNVFEQSAPKAKAIVAGMTLYASSADLAMKASRELAGGIPRAGDVPHEGPIVLPNIETIDVTAVGDEFLGVNHDTFAASRNVIDDIAALLHGTSPPRLNQIRQVPDPPSTMRYWRFVP
jgi:esterase/lipase superfamily enzyme